MNNQKENASSLTFPTIEEAFSDGVSKTLSRTCSQEHRFVELAKTGSLIDRARARLVAASYRLTTSLLQEIENERVRLDEGSQQALDTKR